MAAKKKSSKSPKKKTAPKKAPAKKKVVAKKPAKKAAPKKKVAKAAPKKVAKAAPKKVAKAAPKKVAKAAPKKVAAPKKASAKPAAKPAKKVAPTQKVMARLAAEQVARSIVHEPHAFVEGKVTSDTLAEELAEDAVLAMTSGEDEEGERDGETEAEKGGPFVVSSGRVEYADDDEAPNIASAEVAGTPTTRDEDEAEDEG